MSSKFAKQIRVPPEFPDILKDFTREVLRNQPDNINEFAAKYFACLAEGLPGDSAAAPRDGGEEPEMSLEEVEAIIQDLFHKYDKDGNRYLDPQEFKALMEDLQQRLDFPKDQIFLFLAEADMNEDGMIEYTEFIPLALQIIQGMYAKKHLEQHMQNVEQHAEDLLVHGMSREELTELVGSIFERMDENQNGYLSKAEFVSSLSSMELGLTRREINTIMFQIDQDRDGNISYREFVPFAFDLLQKLTSLRLLESELEHDDFAQFLMDLFRAKDVEMTGVLPVDELRDVLHQAALGLTRMQIYTVISEADQDNGSIAYAPFIPRAVGLIRSMLSFEKSIVHDAQDAGPEAEDHFHSVMEQALAGVQVVSLDHFLNTLHKCNVVDAKELQASQNLLADYGDEVEVDDAKSQVWALLKSMRRHRS